MIQALALGLGLVVLAACGGAGKSGKRAPENDTYCGDIAKPHAYDYRDQVTAEAEGCGVKRVYGAVKDEKTGKLMDNEIVVFCCPKR